MLTRVEMDPHFLSLVIIAITTSFSNFVNAANDTTFIRLPNNIQPLHYDLQIKPDFELLNFAGSVKIELLILNDTDSIILHSTQLQILNVVVFMCDELENYEVSDVIADEEMQILIIKMQDLLANYSKVYLQVDYEGHLQSTNIGFYRANYTDYDGELRWLAATNFYPVYARYAFPCFDEPNYKAQFSIRITRPQNFISISNMPLISNRVSEDGLISDAFMTTTNISTFSVSFAIVTNFTSVTQTAQSIYARDDLISEQSGSYALEIGESVLHILGDYLGDLNAQIIPKLDIIGLPNISRSSQNWGLLIFKERNVIFHENFTTSYEKQNIIETIAEGYGSQWFGNKLTPKWWSNNWIIKGLSVYLKYYSASVIQPSWGIPESFFLKCWKTIAEEDSLEWSKALSSDIETSSEIISVASTFTENKGAFIIHMLKSFLGTVVFQKGIQILLETIQIGSVDETEVWNAFQEAVEESEMNLPFTVEKIMQTWSSQSGLPLLYVEKESDSQILTISQTRFPTFDDSNHYNLTWNIPISFTSENDPDFSNTLPKFWLNESKQSFPIEQVTDESSWILINLNLTGYYRVNYEINNWIRLTNFLINDNIEIISSLNRAQLIDDAFSLARVGKLNYKIPLELIEYLSKETNYIPLNSFMKSMEFLLKTYRTSIYYAELETFLIKILEPIYESLSIFENQTEDHQTKLLRHEVLLFLCNIGYGECLHNMIEILRLRDDVTPNLQSPVYCGGLKSGSEEDWDYLYSLYQSNSTQQTQKERILSSLGCINNVVLLSRLVSMSITLNSEIWNVHTYDEQFIVLQSLYSNTNLGLTLTLSNLFSGFALLTQRFSNDQISQLLNEVSSRLVTNSQQSLFRQMLQFLPESIRSQHETSIARALLNLDEINDWIANRQPYINEWFEEKMTTTTTEQSTELSPSSSVTFTTTPSTITSDFSTTTQSTTYLPSTTNTEEEENEDDHTDSGSNRSKKNFIYVFQIVLICLVLNF